MKTRTFIFKSLLILTAAAIAFTGCRKKEEEDNDTSAASDNSTAESSFNDLATIAEQGSTGSVTSFRNASDEGSLLSNCATVTINNAVSTNNDTVTVDFGTVNCMCNDGRNRRGKVIAIYTGGANYRDSLLLITITTSNYFVNDNQVLGTKTITNRGHINNNRLQWDITVNGQVILANSEGTVTWTSNRTKVLLAGETTYGGPINWAIAKWEITGNISGTNRHGENFSGLITTPLVRDMTCIYRRHFQFGKFEFTPGSRPTRYVNFDIDENDVNGYDCDALALVTINGNTYQVVLH